MIGAAAAYMAGLFFALFFHNAKIVLIFAAITMLLALIYIRKGLKLRDFAVIAVFFAVSFSAGQLYTHFYYDRIIVYADQNGSFEGEVTDVKYYSGDNALYTLKGKINGVQPAKINYYGNVLNADYGDIVRLEDCKFSVPESTYLFDSESYYKADGIFLNAGYCSSISTEKMNRKIFRKALMSYREKMISKFKISLGDNSGDFLAGMVFGEKQGMSDNLKTSLYRCGIGHILAVSGLHISIIAMVVMGFLKRLRINKYVSFGLVNAVMIMFIAMANYPVSAIRAAIMMNFLCSAKLFRRQNDTFNSLAGAILLICIFNPYAVYSSGFLLSITATFGIGVVGPYMSRNFPKDSSFGKFRRSFVVLLCTSICILPLNMKFFGETSLISPITNLVIVPLCSAALIIGFIFVITGGIIPVLGFADWIIRLVLYISDKVSREDMVYFSCASDTAIYLAFGLAFAVILIQIIFGNRKATAAGLAVSCGIICIFSSVYSRIRFNSFNIAVLGRGNNAAVVVSYHGETIVIDLSGHYRASEYVRKYLSENGIKDVNKMILTTNIPSQYAAFSYDLEMLRIDSWIAFGNECLLETESAEYMQDGFELSGDSYNIEYYDDLLSVNYGGAKVVFSKSKLGIIHENSFNVYYGRIPSKTEKFSGSNIIYVGENSADELNNFEIELSENGGYNIRRL
ncbi:MAG: ComEC/Rec2 family competence protein [Ruminococcus flavefaciens]|nr:ComEC/Rec2 family competence protein [Ruminococcus flavefaciens]MCM1361132.1 ComEC/Rec2 family competence protein [Clostridiales bacterium]